MAQEIVVGIEPFHRKAAGVGDKGGHTRGAERRASHRGRRRKRILDDINRYRVALAIAVVGGGVVGCAAADILHLVGVALSFVVHFAVIPFDIGANG